MMEGMDYDPVRIQLKDKWKMKIKILPCIFEFQILDSSAKASGIITALGNQALLSETKETFNRLPAFLWLDKKPTACIYNLRFLSEVQSV